MIELAHRDAHLVVVQKPSGVATTAPGGADSLTRRIEAQLGRTLHPTSRLDTGVTGLVTFAITKEAIERLRRARAEGAYVRRYLALASGAPAEPRGTWDASIAIDPADRRLRVAIEPGGRGARLQHARSDYEVGGGLAGAAVLWLTPHTGRTHQLRVHAAHAGVPLLGDVRYGGPRRITRDDGSVVRAARVMLHCARLCIPRVEGGELELCCEAPDDLRELWMSLGGDRSALTVE